jgi:hypothetical protein
VRSPSLPGDQAIGFDRSGGSSDGYSLDWSGSTFPVGGKGLDKIVASDILVGYDRLVSQDRETGNIQEV